MGDHDDLVSALIESNKKQQVHITDLLSIMSKQQTTIQSFLPATATSPQRGVRIPEKSSNPTFMQSYTQLEPRGKGAQNATFDFKAPAVHPYFPSLGQRIEKEGEEIREQSIDEIFEEAQKESEAKDKRIKDLEKLVGILKNESKSKWHPTEEVIKREQSIDEIFEEAQKESEAKDKRIKDLEGFVAELNTEAKEKDNTRNTVENHVCTLLKLEGDLNDKLCKVEAELKEKDMMVKKMEERNDGLLAQIGSMGESKSLGVSMSAWRKTEDEAEGDLCPELEQLKRESQTEHASYEQPAEGEEQHDSGLNSQHEPTDDDVEDTQGMTERSGGDSVGNSDESAGLYSPYDLHRAINKPDKKMEKQVNKLNLSINQLGEMVVEKPGTDDRCAGCRETNGD